MEHFILTKKGGCICFLTNQTTVFLFVFCLLLWMYVHVSRWKPVAIHISEESSEIFYIQAKFNQQIQSIKL